MFFQSEDCIRYYKVTGVQTSALPISAEGEAQAVAIATNCFEHAARDDGVLEFRCKRAGDEVVAAAYVETFVAFAEIGRASCRDRGSCHVGIGVLTYTKTLCGRTYLSR